MHHLIGRTNVKSTRSTQSAMLKARKEQRTMCASLRNRGAILLCVLAFLSIGLLQSAAPVAASPTNAVTAQIFSGKSLAMSYGGPPWDYCHHYVHFEYPRSLDGHIGGFGVSGPGSPSAW